MPWPTAKDEASMPGAWCAPFLVALSLMGNVAAAEPNYSLIVSGPLQLYGKVGEVVRATYEVAVLGRGGAADPPSRLEGWGFGVVASGVELDSVSIEGTAAEHAAGYGFERSELTHGPGNEGLISKAIYSLTEPRELEVSFPPAVLLRIAVHVQVPELPTNAALDFHDGLNGSVDMPAQVFVQEDGRRERPKLSGASISVFPYRSLFTMAFDGPPFLVGEPGSIVRTRWMCNLAGTNNVSFHFPGVEGWALGVAGTGCRVTEITVEGTDAEPALTGGFVHNEVLHQPGNEGAVSAVTFSTDPGTVLPMDYTPRRIAALDLETWIPEGESTASLAFVDGLRSSRGVVMNLVVEKGEEVLPRTREGSMHLASTPPCGTHLLGFSSAPIWSAAAFDGVIGGTRTSGEVVVPVPAASTAAEATVYADLIDTGDSPTGCDEVQGLALSVEVEGDAAPISATIAEPFLAWLEGGFTRSDVVNPARNAGRAGFVAVWVPSFCCQNALPPHGTLSVLRMALKPSRPILETGAVAQLRFRDGLVGVGQPVMNSITVCGATHVPCNVNDASAEIRFLPSEGLFLRGNANGDLRVDIADAVWVLGFLFSGGQGASCAGAADSNDDGTLDVSDAIHILRYEFLGGPPPVAPFPGCGVDPTPTAGVTSCAESQVGCR